MKPLIGVTTAVRSISPNGVTFCTAYTAIIAALERAGALPVMIPSNVSDDTLRSIYERLDGVMLPGGGDIDPEYYHANRHPKTVVNDPLRDVTEVKLVRWAVADDLPLFGICRGHQVINVALGGTLIQDIPSEVASPDLKPHDIPEGLPRSTHMHEIAVNETSRLASIMGATRVPVNSLHHQAVKEVAPGFIPTAVSPDGVIEAMEMPEKRFALSVQWHPEDLAADDGKMQAIFDAFVKACAERVKA
jgi:putative glutamine amidotransferase